MSEEKGPQKGVM